MAIIKRKQIINPDHKVSFFSEVFSSTLWVGHIPVASGTFGTFFGLLFFFIPIFNTYYILIPAIIICFLLGVFTSEQMIKRYGHDPSVVVIDEVVGVWITMLFVVHVMEYVDLQLQLITLGIAFLTFRFFDIIKVWPSKHFDRMNSGWGIMMDDIIAGLYAGIVTFFIIHLLILTAISIGLDGKVL